MIRENKKAGYQQETTHIMIILMNTTIKMMEEQKTHVEKKIGRIWKIKGKEDFTVSWGSMGLSFCYYCVEKLQYILIEREWGFPLPLQLSL